MSKYQQYYQTMLTQNEELFKNFRVVHDNYTKDNQKYRSEFNKMGRDVQDVIRDYEDRLCSHSENSGYGKFSTSLSDKFWDEIRKSFPKIDEVGLIGVS